MSQRHAIAAAGLLVTLITAQGLLVMLAPGLAGRKPTDFAEVLPLIGLLSLPAAIGILAAMIVLPRAPAAHGVFLVAAIVAGYLMRLMWFGTPAPLEDDFYRYLWDGAVTGNGGNPYRVAPERVAAAALSDPALARLLAASGDTLRHINFPDLTTIYPGTAQLAFAAAYRLKPFGVDGLRAVFLFADTATLLALMALLARLGASPLQALLYWLNPLVVFAAFGLVHVDVLVVPFVLAAVIASLSARPLACGLMLALAAGVKLWPVLLAPLLLGQTARTSISRAATAFGLMVLLTVVLAGPLALSAAARGSGLVAYAASWHINNGPYAWASYGLYLLSGDSSLAQRALRASVGLAAVAIALRAAIGLRPGLRRFADREVVARTLLIAAAVFYLSPAQFPWYALWFLPLAAVLRSYPLLASSIALSAYFTFFPLWETGRGGVFLYGAAFLHSVPVALWLAVEFWRKPRAAIEKRQETFA